MNLMVPVTGFLYALWLWSAMLLCARLGHINGQRQSSKVGRNSPGGWALSAKVVG